MGKERGNHTLWKKKYTNVEGYKAYVDYVGKEAALPKEVFKKCMARFFWKLSRIIITQNYEWKMPNRLGFIRIEKRKAMGMAVDKNVLRTGGKLVFTDFHLTGGYKFFWKWDRQNKNTLLTRKYMWEFDPVVDWKEKKIGERGLNNHVIKCVLDPRVEDYDVINRRHL